MYVTVDCTFMASMMNALSEFVQNFVAFILMIILAIISFFFTVFVVDVGAGLAVYPGDDFVVLSAALLVSAAIIAGGISPLGYLSQTNQTESPKQSSSKKK